MDRNPASYVKAPRRPERPKGRGLSADELRAFLSFADQEPPAERALCYLLAYTGARISEAVGLDVDALRHESAHRTVEILGKGERERSAPVPDRAWKVIHAAAGRRRKGALLRSQGGRRLDRFAGAKIVRRVAERAGLDGRPVTPHSLRRAYITLSLRAGAPLQDVQDAVGHADPRTTRLYDVAERSLDQAPVFALERYLEGGDD